MALLQVSVILNLHMSWLLPTNDITQQNNTKEGIDEQHWRLKQTEIVDFENLFASSFFSLSAILLIIHICCIAIQKRYLSHMNTSVSSNANQLGWRIFKQDHLTSVTKTYTANKYSLTSDTDLLLIFCLEHNMFGRHVCSLWGILLICY